MKKIQLLISKINIANSDQDVVTMAARNKAITDFEDGLEYYSAVNAGCQCIITEDIDDFHFSRVEVFRSQQFLEQYVL
jgi:predicted nucleic acid-binding protein